MMISRRDSRRRAVLAALMVTLFPGIIIEGNAFLMPVDFTSSLQSYHRIISSSCNERTNCKHIFSIQHFNVNQWADEEEIDEVSPERKYFEISKRAVLGGAAIGTLMAINSAASASAESTVDKVQSSEVPVSVKSASSSTLNEQSAVTLPYLEEQIKVAEAVQVATAQDGIKKEALTQQSNYDMTPTIPSVSVVQVATAQDGIQKEALTQQSNYDVTPTIPSASVVQVATTQDRIQKEALTQQSSYDVTPTIPSALVVTNVQEKTTVATASTATINIDKTPSLIQFVQGHVPGWIEIGQKLYKAVEPKIIAGGQKLVAEIDKRVTPKIIEVERRTLGEENSIILDKTLSKVTMGGGNIAGIVGKVVSFGVDGGKMVVKATPDVISAGKQVYKVVDGTILPEVIDTSRRMKSIIDETVPEVVNTGKHAYDTIMPEVMNAEKQIASTMKEGVSIAMPIVNEIEKTIEKTIAPEFTQIERNIIDYERNILGYEQATMLENSVFEAAQTGQNIAHTVEKMTPDVFAAGQQTVESITTTGRSVAKTVPVIVQTGKHLYGNVDKSFTNALSTTRIIAMDLDRTGGKAAYAIEEQIFDAAENIEKALPTLLDTGRQVAVTVPEIAKTIIKSCRRTQYPN